MTPELPCYGNSREDSRLLDTVYRKIRKIPLLSNLYRRIFKENEIEDEDVLSKASTQLVLQKERFV